MIQQREELVAVLLAGSLARDSRSEEKEVKETPQSATPKYTLSKGGEGSSGGGGGPREATTLPAIPKKLPYRLV